MARRRLWPTIGNDSSLAEAAGDALPGSDLHSQIRAPTEKEVAMPKEEKDMSELTDEEQVALISQTDNSLKSEDEEMEQPPQDPDYVADDATQRA